MNITLILGLCSLLQGLFLPGYLLLRILKYKADKLTITIISYGLSLVINYYLVLITVSLGIFNTSLVRMFFAIELVLLFYFCRSKIKSPSFFNTLKISFTNPKTIAIGVLIGIISYIIANSFYVSVFTNWDAVVSWNRWAKEWNAGILPHTWGYPQLLTTNWALMYKLIGEKIQYFPYLLCSSFTFYSLLIPFSLAKIDIKNKESWYFAVVLVLILINPLIGDKGYADLPVALMGFLSVYVIITTIFMDSTDTYKKALLIAGVLLGGAASTKQAGIFIVTISPFIVWKTISYNKSIILSKGKKIKYILCMLCTAIIIFMPWYIYCNWLIHTGRDAGVTNMLLHLTWQDGFFSLIKHAIISKFHILRFLILILAVLFTWKNSFCRFFSYTIIIPYFLIWIFMFGYDARNASILLPFVGCIAGFAVQNIVFYLNHKKNKVLFFLKFLINKLCLLASIIIDILIKIINTILNRKYFYKISLIIILLILFLPCFSSKNIEARQNRYLLNIYKPVVNHKLYEMVKNKQIDGKIFTNYGVICHMPLLEDISIQNGGPWFSYEIVKKSKAKYLLLMPLSEKYKSKLENEINKGYYKRIFECKGYEFLLVNYL